MGNMKKLNKGFFIVFEGIDGSGKSLQASMTSACLREEGYDVAELVEPSRGIWGMKIREVLSGRADPVPPEEELELFIRDRRDNVHNNVIPMLEDYRIVVQDRYYYSTLAYQGARGFSLEEIRNRHGSFILEPDLVFMLDISPEEAIGRIRNLRNTEFSIFEKQSYLEKVKEIYNSFSGPHIVHINAISTPDSINREIMNRVRKILTRT
jgi:dTMP kinase